MPSTYAHYRMGQEVYGKLEGIPKKIIEKYKELYDIGLHGPDILFYYKPLYEHPVNKTGYDMHSEPGISFFKRAYDIIVQKKDKQAYLAYIYGFCCHFALDVSCHGYIDYKIKNSGISHTEIEVEFDRRLMLKDGYNPITHRLTGHINPNEYNSQIISSFYENITPGQVQQALKGMINYNNLLIEPSHIKRMFIYGLLKATGNYKEMHGLIVNYNENPSCADSTKQLYKLYKDARQLAVKLINEYTDSGAGKIAFDEKYSYTFGGEKGKISKGSEEWRVLWE